jgi:hypothetical protein
MPREDFGKVDWNQFKVAPGKTPLNPRGSVVTERLVELNRLGPTIGDQPVHLGREMWDAIRLLAKTCGCEMGMEFLSKAEGRRFGTALEESLYALKAVIQLCNEGRGLTHKLVSPHVTKVVPLRRRTN